MLGKDFTKPAEQAVLQHRHDDGPPSTVSWRELPGTGSTSCRYVLELTYPNESTKYVVKQYCIEGLCADESKRQALREYTALKELQGLASTLWRAPTPVAYLGDHACVIMEFAAGENVNRLFWKAVRSGKLAFAHIERLSKVLQDIATIMLEFHRAGKELLSIVAANEQWYSSFLNEQVKALSDFGYAERTLTRLTGIFGDALPAMLLAENTGFQHTDLYFNNMLMTDDRYCVLDFPNACRGTRYWDISHLFVSLEHYYLFRNVDSDLVAKLESAFLENFSYDEDIMLAMNLVHYSFALKICTLAPRSGLKRLLMRDPLRYYASKIDETISRLAS